MQNYTDLKTLFRVWAFSGRLSDCSLKNKGVRIFQHDGPSMVGRMACNLPPVDKTAVVIIDQIEVIALAWIVSYAEVPHKIILGIHILHQEIGRELGADHDLSLHVDRVDVEFVVGCPVGEGKVVELISRG